MLYDLNTWDLDVNSLYGQTYTHRMSEPITWIHIKPSFFDIWWRGGSYTFSYSMVSKEVENELERVRDYLIESGLDIKTKKWSSSIEMGPDRHRVSFYYTIQFRRVADCMQFKLAYLDAHL